MTRAVPPHVDVAIVGGGPGGAAAAITAARAGLAAVVLVAGSATRPGETLHPGVEPLFTRLRVAEAVAAAGFLRHRGHWVEWGGPARFEEFGSDADGPWLGYQAPADVLDPLLLTAAERAGATVMRGRRAVRPLLEGGRVTGVETTAGPLIARVVIDAGGRRHWLARHLRVPVHRVSPRLVVAYGHTDGVPSGLSAPVLRADPSGWTWTAPVAADTSAWMRLALPASRPHRWGAAPPELAGLPARGPLRGADVTWRRAATCAGPGWFLVGDAAAVVDPAASHGVLRALMSGMLAAHTAAECAGDRDEGRAAAGYSRWLREWFDHDTSRLDAAYRVFASWGGVAP